MKSPARRPIFGTAEKAVDEYGQPKIDSGVWGEPTAPNEPFILRRG